MAELSTPTIARVIAWANGMVSVFDGDGRQVPEYQGPLDQVQAAILRDAPATAEFRGGNWRVGQCWCLTREEFAERRGK